MAACESLCVRCARYQQTCCQGREIFITLGDVQRITALVGQTPFFEFAATTDPDYLDQDDDPTWRENVFRPDGTRRILSRQSNGDCVFLGPEGCRLSLTDRPLVCRLYPLDYNEQGLDPVPSSYCPTHLLVPGEDQLASTGVCLDEAVAWHRQLYKEIRWEKASPCTLV